VADIARLLGAWEKCWIRFLRKLWTLRGLSSLRKTKIDISKDLHAFTELIGKEKLFTITPGREFKAFPEFCYMVEVKDPGRFKIKMQQLSKRLDKIRRCCKS